MKESKKQIPQKSIRSVDAVRRSVASMRKNTQLAADIHPKTRLGVVYIAAKSFARRVPENLTVSARRVG